MPDCPSKPGAAPVGLGGGCGRGDLLDGRSGEILADALRESGLLELTSDMFNVGMLLVGAMILVHLSSTRSTFSIARTGGLRMGNDDVARILKRNPSIDRTAIDRSQQAAKQLADVGVKVGGYRLEPALGGKLVRSSGQSPVRNGRQR